MSRPLYRRKCRILLFIAIGGTIFIFFQFFALKLLNASTRSGTKTEGHVDMFANDFDDPYLDDIKIAHVDVRENRIHNPDSHDREGAADISKMASDQKTQDKNKSSLPIGVHSKDADLYKPNQAGLFQCLSSKEQIPYSNVNDDFCDCEDSSDEPGTSACPNSRFYCRFQVEKRDPQYIPSSRVNDGICDCCDGSDEWADNLVPLHIRITEKTRRYAALHAPCEDRCTKIIESMKEDEKIRKLGLRLKVTYLESAKQVGKKEQYGPDGVFYKLSQQCFPHNASGYEYTVCPFRSVKQQRFPQPSVVLGKTPEWQPMFGGAHTLRMVNGDNKQCPDYQGRTCTMYFICGLMDRVLHVAENEICSYEVRFSSPAAC